MSSRTHNILFSLIFLLTTGCFENDSKTGTTASVSKLHDTITVTAYNVENLFDITLNGSEYDEYVPGNNNWTHTTFATKLNNIASVIAEISPHILILTEIENRSALDHLIDKLKAKDCHYRHSIIGDKPNPTTTCPAILSRYPIVSNRMFGTAKTEGYFSRNILEADILCGTDTLKIFANHWPSKRHPESRRIAAAKIIAQRIQELPSSCDYIIAGDLNENYNEYESFRNTRHDDTRGKTALQHILATAESTPDRFPDYLTEQELREKTSHAFHYDLWFEIPAHRRMSNTYRGIPQTPDHFLLPRALYDSYGISYCDNSFSPFTWNGRLLRDGVPWRWQKQYRDRNAYHLGVGFSDHLPISAQFYCGPFRFKKDASPKMSEQRETTLSRGICGFETGYEGWVRCDRDITLKRIFENASSGKSCLALDGFPTRKNVCAARCTFPLPGQKAKAATLLIDIRGKGKLNIRTRSRDSKWRYYNYENFSPSGSGRYTFYTFDIWTTIACALPETAQKVSSIEIELRAGKGSEFSFFIDNIRIDANT
ncbi:MAG: hypothetical protein GF401_02955 [Chitinivibrionales bacterium]|nr:hypothetical protein [Chitinivibrionales bacterium]